MKLTTILGCAALAVVGALLAQPIDRAGIQMSWTSFCVSPPQSIDTLVKHADFATVVQILESESSVGRGEQPFASARVVTRFTAYVEDSLGGFEIPAPGDVIAIWEKGGIAHFEGQLHLSEWVGSANLIPTKRYLLFLKKTPTPGEHIVAIGKYGAFRLVGDWMLPNHRAPKLMEDHAGRDLHTALWEIEALFQEKMVARSN